MTWVRGTFFSVACASIARRVLFKFSRLGDFSTKCGPAIVEKENTLAESPQRGGEEFIATSGALADAIRQP